MRGNKEQKTEWENREGVQKISLRERRGITLLEGTWALPPRLSVKNNVKVTTLRIVIRIVLTRTVFIFILKCIVGKENLWALRARSLILILISLNGEDCMRGIH